MPKQVILVNVTSEILMCQMLSSKLNKNEEAFMARLLEVPPLLVFIVYLQVSVPPKTLLAMTFAFNRLSHV